MIFRNSKFIIGILSSIALFLLAVMVFGIYDIRAKNQETSKLLNDARQITEVDGLTQSIRTVQASSKEDSLVLDELAFTNERLVPLIEGIEEKGESLNLDTSISSVERKDGTNPSDPNLIRMVVETRGSWASNSRFLHALESLPYRVMIEKTDFSQGQEGWFLRVVFSIHSFD